jgi:hypothetical protein
MRICLKFITSDVPKSEVSDEIKGIVDRMSEKDIEKYAKTKHKGLPNKVEMEMESLINKIDEKWSDKYKRSIDCNNPKGFSQRAHCQGRKKNESNIKNSSGLLKNILKEQQLPKVLYHSVTDERVRDFVLKNGIKMDSQGFVYLSKKPITRLPFKYTFKVKIPDMDALYDWRDVWDAGLDKEYDKTNPYYIYNNDIPKQYIKLI